MLNYKIRMNPSQISQETLKWRERYVAPDLSYVSGVTDTSYNLGSFKSLSVESRAGGGTDIVYVMSKDVRRTGFIVVVGKIYQVHSGVAYNNISSLNVSYKYVELNGKYYYATGNSFTIKDWLVDNAGEVTNKDVTVTIGESGSGEVIRLDTIYWLKNNVVTIDGDDYFLDPEEVISGLRYYENGEIIPATAVTKCSEILFHKFSKPQVVTEFMLMKVPDREVMFDSVGFCDYYFFVLYKNTYCNVVASGDTFVCLVPKELIGESGPGYSALTLYRYEEDMGGDEIPVTSVTDPIWLRDNYTFVKIDNENIQVTHTVVNSNGGPRMMVYLTNDAIVKNLNPGNRIVFKSGEIDFFLPVSVEESGDEREFVLFNGKKHFVESNICDKAVLSGFEYEIEYINGKVGGKDCLVIIEGEKIPMRLIHNGNSWGVSPYQKVVKSTSSSALTDTVYDVVSYDGVVIGGKKYLIHVEKDSEDEVVDKYAVYDKGNEYAVIVEEIVGSSAVVCYPDIHGAEFTDSFIKNWEGLIMTNIVYDSGNLTLYVPNTIFGTEQITPQLAVTNMMYSDGTNVNIPACSDEYYDIVSDLNIYINNRYINVPLMLDLNNGGNPLQSDVSESQFYYDENGRAVNRIVDMEYDVYTPKVLVDNTYSGSSSTFRDITELQINLHFRTRNDAWKVNEAYKAGWDTAADKKSNWFITDFYPYAYSGDTEKLDSLSDLVGLLNFDNADVYYQKSKIAKSFLRLSYYDSIDQQTQSLLHTSTVFMDEHGLYKKYIDGTRNGKTKYKEAELDKEDSLELEKISVKAEPYEGDYSFTYDDSHRLSSRFTIKSKYATDTSSEGFYLYMFKEYSSNLRPKQVFLKVEFNHAGIGHTIPFMKPMIFSGGTGDSVWCPKSGITLSDSGDVEKLKEGIRLNDFYSDIYIPLYAVFDFKNKEYAYVFDNRYVNVDDNGVAVLNLFEVKIKDESEAPESGTVEEPKHVIDINSQFIET